MPSTRTRRSILGLLAALTAGAGCTTRSDDPTPGNPQTERSVTSSSDTESTVERTLGNIELDGPWPTFGADPGHTGVVDGPAPTEGVVERWRSQLGTNGDVYPALGGNRPYVATARGTLVALDDEGGERWRTSLGGRVVSAPVATDDRVVAGTVDGTIVAYTPNGERRWEMSTRHGLYAPHRSDGTVFAVADETLLVAHQREGLLAFGLDDGRRDWTRPVDGRLHRPVIVDDTVFASTDPHDSAGSVVALSLATGDERWTTSVEEGASVAPGYHDGVVYTGTHRGKVYAFDASDGSERWQSSTDDWVSTIPVVAAETLWVGTLDGTLFEFSLDGSLSGQYNLGLTTPVVDGDVLYAGFDDGVAAFDAASGEVRWRQSLDSPAHPPLALDGDRLYAGGRLGDCYALNPTDGTVEWTVVSRPETVPSPVVAGRAVYVAGTNGSLAGIVARSGKDLWRPNIGEVAASPTALRDGILTTHPDGDVTATAPLDYGDRPTDRMTATATPSETQTTVHIDLPTAEQRWVTSVGDSITEGVGYADGVAYLPTGAELVAVNAGDGSERWRTTLDSRITTTPAVGNGSVVVATEAGVTVVAAANGDVSVRYDVDGGVRGSPAIRDGTVVFGGDDGTVRALTLAGGNERWRVETGGSVLGSPALTTEIAVVGSDDGTVRALALNDGSERWRVDTGGAVRSSPAVAAETVFVGSRDRTLYALAVADGTVRWRHELDNWVDGSPAVGYGAVFVTDQSGTCYCLVGRA